MYIYYRKSIYYLIIHKKIYEKICKNLKMNAYYYLVHVAANRVRIQYVYTCIYTLIYVYILLYGCICVLLYRKKREKEKIKRLSKHGTVYNNNCE